MIEIHLKHSNSRASASHVFALLFINTDKSKHSLYHRPYHPALPHKEKPIAAMTSVYLSNLSPTTTKESLDKFMAFCGSIHNIEMLDSNKAVVTFEKPSAASTALMLNGGTLDGSPIHVSSEDVSEDTPSIAGDLHDHDDIPQEAKPRTAIIAEYLAHGYIIGDNIIAKAVDYDQKNGISARFLEFFNKLSEQVKHKTAEVDANLHVTERAAGAYQQADEKVHLSDRAKNVWRVGKQYYSKVLSSEFGQQAQSFYTQTSNNIKSVHDEAQRIAAEKKHVSSSATSGLESSAATGGSGLTATSAGAPISETTATANVPESAIPVTSAPRLA